MIGDEIEREIQTLKAEREDLILRLDIVDQKIVSLLANDNSHQSKYKRLLKDIAWKEV